MPEHDYWLPSSAKFKMSGTVPPLHHVPSWPAERKVLVLCFMVREVVRHAVVQCVSNDEIYTPSQYVSCQHVKAILRHSILSLYRAKK